MTGPPRRAPEITVFLKVRSRCVAKSVVEANGKLGCGVHKAGRGVVERHQVTNCGNRKGAAIGFLRQV